MLAVRNASLYFKPCRSKSKEIKISKEVSVWQKALHFETEINEDANSFLREKTARLTI